MNHKRLLDIAAGVALTCPARQSFRFGAVALTSDNRIISSTNGQTYQPIWSHHAEAKLLKWVPRKGNNVVAVVRLTANGLWAIAKPCPSCHVLLQRASVSKVLYSTGPDSFDIMEFSL